MTTEEERRHAIYMIFLLTYPRGLHVFAPKESDVPAILAAELKAAANDGYLSIQRLVLEDDALAHTRRYKAALSNREATCAIIHDLVNEGGLTIFRGSGELRPDGTTPDHEFIVVATL